MRRDYGQFKQTETLHAMTPTEVSSFKEKWRVLLHLKPSIYQMMLKYHILWHPEVTDEEIIDFDQALQSPSLVPLGEPGIYTEVEATPSAPQIPLAPQAPVPINKESMNEAKPKKEKRRFWCCC